ncbi:hypothetical protein DFH09DRAFT_1324284 [Mycena vulgaris]|nr:hypothetical protein DFH09DRAFT_1324284 [Mycena vulgaris]
MSSRSDLDIDLDAQLAAAMVDSPMPATPHNPRKRRREDREDSTEGQDSQEEDDDTLPTSITADTGPPGVPSSSNANKNVLAFAKQFATHKRLRPSQIAEVETFAADPIATRQIKMYTPWNYVFFATVRPEFEVLSISQKNIHQLAIGVLVSPKLASYKGSLPTNLLNILKKKRFDLPLGIEFITSDWAVVKSRAEYHLTQGRSGFKKCLVKSVEAKDATEHTNIFVLGQRFVRDTDTTLTTPLCARIALMVGLLSLI